MMRLKSIFGRGLHKTALASALSLVLFAAFGASALAGELPKQGTYSLTWTFSGPYTLLEVGEDEWAWISNFTLVIWNNAGEGIYHDMTGDCIEIGGPERQTSGYCTYTDADGDKIFEAYTEEEEGKGHDTLTGGTGKYAGLQGGGKYEYAFTPDTPEGTFHGYGHTEGSYTLR